VAVVVAEPDIMQGLEVQVATPTAETRSVFQETQADLVVQTLVVAAEVPDTQTHQTTAATAEQAVAEGLLDRLATQDHIYHQVVHLQVVLEAALVLIFQARRILLGPQRVLV
jgi:hypothetical protein